MYKSSFKTVSNLSLRHNLSNRKFKSTSVGSKASHKRISTPNDISYIRDLVKKDDHENYIVSLFSPPKSREALWAIRAFSMELSNVSNNLSHSEMAVLKLQWWLNNINNIYNGTPQQTPLSRVLYDSVHDLGISKMWFTRHIKARINSASSKNQYKNISDIEKFGEQSAACNIHAHLESLGVRDMNADNGARLIGQAESIANVLKNIPYMASMNKCQIPEDLLEKYNIKEIGKDKKSKSLENAVYDMASVGFTRLCGVAEIYVPNSPKNAFSAFLSAVPLKLWFERLEKVNFDIYHPSLHRRSFTLPFRVWREFNRKSLL
ncbi:hypothetical protein BB558_004250 [Smittium angustum]|uniref:Uncharacterized protein n=1 Tax=Smittium angustum TaxID=133377 RepID=A0A2U1IV29_SMIAN|nr:hypothetical protein BB558_007421 [Smittium angustum]PVZ99719.1 hypothetical protein BB558_004250 [Smittium angustum]